MPTQTMVHLIDSDSGRRAAIARLFYSKRIHTEIYEGLWEFADRIPVDGVILAWDSGDPFAADNLFALLENRGRHLSLVMYGSSPGVQQVVRAMKSGAGAYLQWPFAAEEAQRTVSDVARQGLRERRVHRKVAEAIKAVKSLSPREFEVLEALVRGHSNKEIARNLEISPRTVEIHRANMLAKLDARSSADAVRFGIYAGLDEEPDGPSETSYPRLVSTRN